MRRRNIVILIAVLLTLAIAGFYLLLLYYATITPPPPVRINPSLDLKVLDSGASDYGDSGKVIYMLTQLNGKDISEADINVQLFDSETPRDIYLLDYSSPSFSGCIECEGLPDFKTSLEATLKKYDLIEANSTLNQIKINQLDKITHRSILIVPTGKIPAQLVGLESGPDLNDLMNKGFVIIFIGRDLEEALYANGSVVRIPPGTLSSYGFGYQPSSSLVTCSGYHLQNPAFIISPSLIGCSISYVNKADGYFIVFPRSIDIGWNARGDLAGQDVGRLIYEAEWRQPLITGSLKVPGSMIHPANSSPFMIFLNPSIYTSGWAKILITATTLNGSSMYYIRYTGVSSHINGRVIHPVQAQQGDTILIDFELSENFTEPKNVNISVVAYKNMQQISKQFARNIKIQTEYLFSSNFLVNLSVGNYTLNAEDDKGYIYAQSFLNVPPITVSLSPQWDAQPQVFSFTLVVPKDPISATAGFSPLAYKRAYVTVNDTPGANLFPAYSNVSNSNGRFSIMPSQTLGFGTHTFKVNVSGQVILITQSYKKPTSWLDNPLNVAIIILTLIVGVIAVALRRPEKPLYTIDVPDFPPLEKVVVPISKFSVLSLFDSVNREYKWTFMPLSPQELKNEMRRKITYKGVPILITDYNLDRILDELIESGDVVKALNFYGLKTWETKSGRDIRYLALFRLLRNFLINNAIPFTDLNQRKDCDILATVKGDGIYLHIYIDENTLKRALAGTGKNFIVFESKKELEETLKKLDLSYNPLAVILKSEIGVGGIQLIHPGDFGAILGR